MTGEADRGAFGDVTADVATRGGGAGVRVVVGLTLGLTAGLTAGLAVGGGLGETTASKGTRSRGDVARGGRQPEPHAPSMTPQAAATGRPARLKLDRSI